MSICDFGDMIILPAKITSSQFEWMLAICQLDCLTGDYTYVHRIMYHQVYLLGYSTGYFHGEQKTYSWQERFPIHEIGRINGGRRFEPEETCSELAEKHILRWEKLNSDENSGVQKVWNWINFGIQRNSEWISQPRIHGHRRLYVTTAYLFVPNGLYF